MYITKSSCMISNSNLTLGNVNKKRVMQSSWYFPLSDINWLGAAHNRDSGLLLAYLTWNLSVKS